MIYVPTRTRQSTHRVTQPAPRQISREVRRDRFLIVGCGDRLQGDAAVGHLVAMTVSGWGLSSVESIVVEQLGPNLVSNLAKADYAIFVKPCAETDSAQTTQVCPVFVKNPASETIHVADHQCGPETLLLLAQKFHNRYPQSWLIKIPTADSGSGQTFSATAQTGMDRALKTVTQFLRTYQQPQRAFYQA